MSVHDPALIMQLEGKLASFEAERGPLVGIQDAVYRSTLIRQMIDSIHRIQYVDVIQTRDINVGRIDPLSGLFDPLKAAILAKASGDLEEAFWLLFLFVQFGKSIRTGYRLARDVYAATGSGHLWDWQHTSGDPQGFRAWLTANQERLAGGDGVKRRFGNHRKRESIKGDSATGTGATVTSYVAWVKDHASHVALFAQAQENAGSPRATFDGVYRSMDSVTRFGRTARFDYLTMAGKLGLAAIEPGSAYIEGSTGPGSGSRLLFTGNPMAAVSASELDRRLIPLEQHLGLHFGMQVLEDALCNWQKSPGSFVRFHG